MMVLGGGGDDSMSPETGLSCDIVGKLNVLLTESDDESQLSNEGLVEEEKLEEIMQELYKEITSSSSCNTSAPTVTLPSPSSSSSSPLSLSSLPFFSVNDVKSESCGASMSDSSSTMMAGIEFVGPAGKLSDLKIGLPETRNGSPENKLWVMGMGFEDNTYTSNNVVGGGGGEKEEEEEMEGCDHEGGVVDDDQWLARVLGWGPLELEEWT